VVSRLGDDRYQDHKRLIASDLAAAFFECILEQAKQAGAAGLNLASASLWWS
jgi:hypothetical protein